MKLRTKVHQFILFTIIGLCIFTSCDKPSDVEKKLTISEEKLIEILADVHLAEAVIQSLPGLQRDSVSEVYYSSIFRIHEITESEFLKNREALLLDPEFADALYEKVIEHLSKQETKASKGSGQNFRNPVMTDEEQGKE